MGNQLAVALAIAVSVCTNFVLNRRFTFSHSREAPMAEQFMKYVASVSLGVLVNYVVVSMVLNTYADIQVQLASLAGIAAAMVFNFTAMKFIVFKRKFYKSSK
jgi:dolichol-phosphate mannosyltransferase